MDENYNPQYSSCNTVDESVVNSMIRKVYVWMFGALAITGITAFYVAVNAGAMEFVFGNPRNIIFLFIAELALVIGLNATINRISALTATLLFLLYSVVNGVMLASIFVVYELGSIATTFFVAAGSFAVMAVVGAFTKKDLTKIGNLCLMAVIGLILAAVVNIFVRSTVLELIVSCVGVLVFVGLTAYDAQKIKAMLYGAEENDTTSKIAVLGALSLYLDFINLFLYLLRFLGRRK